MIQISNIIQDVRAGRSVHLESPDTYLSLFQITPGTVEATGMSNVVLPNIRALFDADRTHPSVTKVEEHSNSASIMFTHQSRSYSFRGDSRLVINHNICVSDDDPEQLSRLLEDALYNCSRPM
jgi:hypothetical protein